MAQAARSSACRRAAALRMCAARLACVQSLVHVGSPECRSANAARVQASAMCAHVRRGCIPARCKCAHAGALVMRALGCACKQSRLLAVQPAVACVQRALQDAVAGECMQSRLRARNLSGHACAAVCVHAIWRACLRIRLRACTATSSACMPTVGNRINIVTIFFSAS
jgi:hypothetical protein